MTIGEVTMHHLLDKAYELYHSQLTNSPARKIYVKRRKQSSKGLCHLHLLCRRKRTRASGLLQRTGGKSIHIKAQKGKRLSQRLSSNRETSSLFPHRADQNHRTSNGIQAVPHPDKGESKELEQGGPSE